MSGFSDYWENEVLDHLFGKGFYAPPIVYVALSTADPQDDEAGTAEPADVSYARIATTGADWSVASGGCVSNVDAIEFGEATVSWGTITHFALYDADTGGRLLAHGTLQDAHPVVAGDIVRFPAAGLQVSLD